MPLYDPADHTRVNALNGNCPSKNFFRLGIGIGSTVDQSVGRSVGQEKGEINPSCLCHMPARITVHTRKIIPCALTRVVRFV